MEIDLRLQIKKQLGVHKFLKDKYMDYHTVKQLIFGYLGYSAPHF